MTKKVKKGRRANYLLAAGAIIGLLLPVVVGVGIAVTPDAVLRVGDVGTFNTSISSGSGVLVPMTTTVQTSTGSIAVLGPMSAVREQPLYVEDRLKSGLHLCIQAPEPVCAAIAGQWTGPMQPAQRVRPAIAWFATHFSGSMAGLWFFVGLILTFVLGVGAARDPTLDDVK